MSTKHLFVILVSLVGLGMSQAQQTVLVQNNQDLSIRFDGRITYDAAIYIPQSDIGRLRYGDDDFRFSNGGNLSQMRLGLHANLGTKWSGRFDADFSNRRVAMTDAVLFWHIDKNSRLILGYFKDPVSMENNTASKYLNVATPMAVGLLTRGERYIGATYVRWGKQYWFSGGFYGGSLSMEYLPKANRGNDGYGISARAAYVPIDNEYTTLHIGTSARVRIPDGVSGTMTMSTLPESTMDSRRFVSQKLTGVDSYWVGGLEAALKFDRLFLTGEYLVNQYNYKNSYSMTSGWTITASYSLLGKQRMYSKTEAVFNPTGLLGRNGGLELIGRIGSVSLNDVRDHFKGGSAFSSMIGLNWYPRANLLFAINYTYLNHDKYATAGNLIVPKEGLTFLGVDFHTLQARAQFIF